MGLARLLEPEHRAIDASTFATGDGWSSLTTSGELVTVERALAVPAFSSCVRRKQDALMAMPVDAYVTDGNRRRAVTGPGWLKRPNVDESWKPFIGRVGRSLELCSNAYVNVSRDKAGRAQELHVIPRTSVVVGWRNGRKVFDVDGREYAGEVIHIQRSPSDVGPWGVSVVDENRDTFGLALAVQGFAAEAFGSGAIPPIVFEMEGQYDSTAVPLWLQSWVRRYSGKGRRHKPGLLYGGKVKELTRDMRKSQLQEVQNDLGVQIAALCGMPPQFIGLSVAGNSVPYQNVVDSFVDFMRKAMLSPMGLIEEALSDDFHMLMPRATRVRFRTEIFEKPDTKGRYEIYKIGIDAGFLTVEDVRAWEDLDPLPETTENTNARAAFETWLIERTAA